jgi:hypothetical protein
MKTTLFGTPRMPDDPTKPDPPDSPAPASTPTPLNSEKTPAAPAGAPPTMLRGFREAHPEEYGKDYVIGGQFPKRRH